MRVQNYMEKHKVGGLFEELMNKVVHDMPDEPLLYIIKVLYKKAGKPIPDDLKFTAMRRSASDLQASRSHGSPEPTRKAKMSPSPMTAWGPTGTDGTGKDRDYTKPWLVSNLKKQKSKKSSEEADVKQGHKPKSDWNNDNKVAMTTSFDDVWESRDALKSGKPPGGASQKQGLGPIKATEKQGLKSPEKSGHRSWGTVGLGEGEEHVYSSSGYRGPHKSDISDEDLLAQEMIAPSTRHAKEEEHCETITAVPVSGRIRGPKAAAEKHRMELAKSLVESERVSIDSGVNMGREESDDDALELLEDADDLAREGVTNIPQKSYQVSKIMRQRQAEPEVKLNINLYANRGPSPSEPADATKYGELPGYQGDRDTPIGQYLVESEDEFESVSQVTGPRHPVWNGADSDEDEPRPLSGLQRKSVTMVSPHRSTSPEAAKMSRITPMKSHDYYTSQSMESADMFGGNTGQETPDLQTDKGIGAYSRGWNVADESDASVTDWKVNRKGK